MGPDVSWKYYSVTLVIIFLNFINGIFHNKPCKHVHPKIHEVSNA